MVTQTPVTELMKKRFSCRSYSGRALDSETKESVSSFLSGNIKTLFGSSIRLALLAASSGDSSELKGLGTYGFIKGASAYIVGAVDKSDKNLEDYGYVMEKIILQATGLELGTCWLGGTFSKSSFAGRISLGKSEVMPAVVALGYKAEKRRLFDSTMRLIAGSANRKSFHDLFFDRHFSTSLDPAQCGPYVMPLEMVRIAPSATNRQPWRIVRDKDQNVFHLFLQRTKNYYKNNQKLFGIMDLQRIDMGIAMCHFELACGEAGIEGAWTLNGAVSARDLKLPELTSYVATWGREPGN